MPISEIQPCTACHGLRFVPNADSTDHIPCVPCLATGVTLHRDQQADRRGSESALIVLLTGVALVGMMAVYNWVGGLF